MSGFNDDGGDPSVTDQQLRRDAAAAIHRRCDHVKNSGYQPWLDVVSDVEYKYGVNQGSGP